MFEKNIETEEHAQRMRQIALKMETALNLPKNEQDELILLCLLHDVGKIGVPDKILTKAGELSSEEWEMMKTHSEIGCRVAKSIKEIAHIADKILYHHERWDGKGYPLGLQGTEIPMLSRILAVIDTYDVMTHARPYKDSVSPREAINEIRRCSGTQFAPDIVDVFLKLMEDPPATY